MKNFIIGYGETLTSSVEVKSGSGKKAHPYSFNEARERLVSDLTQVIDEIDSKPKQQCANGKVVVKFIQHPSYLAKSYYPTQLFKKFGIKDIGSKAMKVRPKKWAVKKHPDDGLASCIFVSGDRDQFEAMLNSVAYDQLPEASQTLIRTIEQVTPFKASDKIKGVEDDVSNLELEVVLHAEEVDKAIKSSFTNYVNSLNGNIDWKRSKSVGGLTFIPVTISKGLESELAEFSHLRALRSVPKLRINRPNSIRSVLKEEFQLPEYEPLKHDFKVCIFDGGLGAENLITPWVTELIPTDVNRSHPKLLAHGGEVCSTYLFGPYDTENKSFQAPYTNVDIVRVISADDKDPDLFDVLTRIEEVLKNKTYKYVNLSLGPQIPIEDDDVNVWTSVIDSLLQDGHCLATVAVGNDGDKDGGYDRIQPPSDMVNCFAVGSSDTKQGNWNRAEYSCIGPGRSPGVVKPDGIIFGGSDKDLFNVYSPQTHSIIGTQGTSYSDRKSVV